MGQLHHHNHKWMNQPQFAHPHSLFRCTCQSSIIHHSAFVRRSLSTPPQCCLSVVLYPFLHTCRSSSIPPHLSFIIHSSTFVIHHPFCYICRSSSVGLLPCLLFCHLFTAPHLSPNIHSFTLSCPPSSTPLHHCVNNQPLLHIILSSIFHTLTSLCQLSATPSHYLVTHYQSLILSPIIHSFILFCHPLSIPSHLSPITHSFPFVTHHLLLQIISSPISHSTALHSASIIHAFTFVTHHPLLHIILLPTIHFFTFLVTLHPLLHICHPSITSQHFDRHLDHYPFFHKVALLTIHQPLLHMLSTDWNTKCFVNCEGQCCQTVLTWPMTFGDTFPGKRLLCVSVKQTYIIWVKVSILFKHI